MRRRATTAGIGDLADRMLRRVDPKGKRFGARAVESWRRVAGPDIGRHTHGVSLREGELLVYVDSSAWANELTLMAEDVRSRVNEDLGEDLVKSVRFTVSRHVGRQRQEERAAAEEQAFYRPERVEPVPLTDVERAQVDYTVASVEDEDMREAAARAMTKYLEWKKARRTPKPPQNASEGVRGDLPPQERK